MTFLPAHHQPFRWLPKHGQPLCVGEWLSQQIARSLVFLPIYTALLVTITLVLHFVLGW